MQGVCGNEWEMPPLRGVPWGLIFGAWVSLFPSHQLSVWDGTLPLWPEHPQSPPVPGGGHLPAAALPTGAAGGTCRVCLCPVTMPLFVAPGPSLLCLWVSTASMKHLLFSTFLCVCEVHLHCFLFWPKATFCSFPGLFFLSLFFVF